MREIEISIEKEDFKNKLGIKDGVDGKTPSKKELLSLIKPLIPEPTEKIIEKIEVIKEVEKEIGATEIKDKLETLEGEDRLDAKAIKNLPEMVTQYAPRIIPTKAVGVQSITAGTNISINNTDPDNPVISAENDATATWGSIQGTLSDQTDLQGALNLKANKSFAIAMAVAL